MQQTRSPAGSRKTDAQGVEVGQGRPGRLVEVDADNSRSQVEAEIEVLERPRVAMAIVPRSFWQV